MCKRFALVYSRCCTGRTTQNTSNQHYMRQIPNAHWCLSCTGDELTLKNSVAELVRLVNCALHPLNSLSCPATGQRCAQTTLRMLQAQSKLTRTILVQQKPVEAGILKINQFAVRENWAHFNGLSQPVGSHRPQALFSQTAILIAICLCCLFNIAINQQLPASQ